MRYADDFVIFTRLRTATERVFGGVICFQTNVLRLVENLANRRIVPADEVEFLGIAFRGLQATINVSDQNVHCCQHRNDERTGRRRGQAIRNCKSPYDLWHRAESIAMGIGQTNA